jgi:hypothetical protein
MKPVSRLHGLIFAILTFVAVDVHANQPADTIYLGGPILTIDGSPQGFTAYRDRPYYDPVGEYASFYKGYAAVTDEQVMDAIGWAFANNIQILTHANGEAASDLLIAAVKDATKKYGKADRRPAGYTKGV